MAIYYDFIETDDTNSIEGKLRAKEVISGVISTGKLARLMKQSHGLSEADAKKYIATLTDSIIDLLLDGYEVQIGELGYISVSVTSKPVNRPKDIKSGSVRFNRVNFRTTRRMQKIFRRARLELVSSVRIRKISVTGTSHERALKLRNYLAENNSISRAEYMKITGLGKNSAVNELNMFMKEGWLCRKGTSREVYYSLND